MTSSVGHRMQRVLLGLTGIILAYGVMVGGSARPSAGSAPLALDGSAAHAPWQRYRNWPQANWDQFNTLAEPEQSPPPPRDGAVRSVPTPILGDPAKGKQLAFTRERGGGCLACHIMGPDTPELPGNVGPNLSQIGAAGRDDVYLFNYVWDARVYNASTVMPPWGAHGLYNAEEVGHIVSFLRTLTQPVKSAGPLDDPAKRPVPAEDRDWQDPFVNPAIELIEAGEKLFGTPGPNGKSCGSCHRAPATALKGWAARMPYFEPRAGKVLGVAEFVTRHAKATTGAEWVMQSQPNTTMTVYLTSLANGAPTKVDVTSAGARAAAERGKALMDVKIGQLNFACNDCHSQSANTWIRGQYLGESRNQTPHFPLWRTSRLEVWDIRKRFQWCAVAIRANELPPDAKEYGDLELYLTSLSNGLAIEAPNIRH